jgi:PhnB protein
MKASNITLLYNGTTEEAFNFYKSVIGGEFINVSRMKDIPGAPPMSEEEANKILHMAFPIGKSIIMGMDLPSSRPAIMMGNNFFITVDTESEEETTRLFNGLSQGGHISMPLAHQFWGSFFGMFTDKFGIQWMLSYATQPA